MGRNWCLFSALFIYFFVLSLSFNIQESVKQAHMDKGGGLIRQRGHWT